jgi:hypothetical protein
MMIWGGLTCLSACLVKPTLVSIAPDHAYVDGCVDVTIQGNHLGEKATGDVGGQALTNVKPAEPDKAKPDWAQDVGFLYTATVPASKDLKPGFQDVHLKVDGEELTLPFGFYYRACPASFVVDVVSYPTVPVTTTSGLQTVTSTTAVNIGDKINLVGCGLDNKVKVEYHLVTITPPVGDSSDTGYVPGSTTIADAPTLTGGLDPVCGTAQASTSVPSGLDPGIYEVWLVHEDGTVSSAEKCTARGGHPIDTYTVTTSTYNYTFPLTWEGDSYTACHPIFVTVGGR